MANFLDNTGLNSLWRRIKEALPFVDVSISGENNGWCKVAQVRCATTYMNTPIVFHLICRGFPASSVEILLASQNGTTPGVIYFVHKTSLLEGSHGTSSNVGYTYADVDGVRTYTLWKKKNERYGLINVHAECRNSWAQFISYDKGISYTEPEGIVYADERYDNVKKQTVYTAKGSATKIPQVTTNAAGQVTLIGEVDIGNAPTATKPLATRLTSSNDLNGIKGDGVGVYWYYWASASVPTNAHSSATAYMEVVRMHDGNYLFQTVYEANSSHLYRRQCRNGTWDAWYRYAKSSTTLSGYGITNAYTKTEVDGLFDGKANKSGDTITGTFTFNGQGGAYAEIDSTSLSFVTSNDSSSVSPLGFFVGNASLENDDLSLSQSGQINFGSTRRISVSSSTGNPIVFTDPSVSSGDNRAILSAREFRGQATDFTSDGGIAQAIDALIDGKLGVTEITSTNPNFDTLTTQGVYNVTSATMNVNGAPEGGQLNVIVLRTNVSSTSFFVTQIAFGDNIYYRKRLLNPSKTDLSGVAWNFLTVGYKMSVGSIGSDANTIYFA